MLNNNKGQSLVEAVLLIALFLFISKLAMDGLKNNEFLITMIQKPLVKIASTIENGSPHASEQPKLDHPNSVNRHISHYGHVE
ncbi:MAG: hypothetical protein MK008_09460 [Bdellovibrionales bacterium]|nr:hypothetical protein [Bdellovibrionales bacterium]